MAISTVARPAAFVLAATHHGTMIVPRFDTFDYPEEPSIPTFGIGHDLLNRGSCAPTEINLGMDLLSLLRQERGDGVSVVDCGANIGTFAISWAIHMAGWGSVLAFEPQRLLYYALCGNAAINNCTNLHAEHAAIGSEMGTISVPILDYCHPSSFGSLELRQSSDNQPIGQSVDYEKTYDVPLVTIDSLQVPRLDMLKIDVEGMEIEVLDGAEATITKHRPMIIIEWVKSDIDKMAARLAVLEYDYLSFGAMTILAFHRDDPTRKFIQVK